MKILKLAKRSNNPPETLLHHEDAEMQVVATIEEINSGQEVRLACGHFRVFLSPADFKKIAAVARHAEDSKMQNRIDEARLKDFGDDLEND
jgi:hypothetical protein